LPETNSCGGSKIPGPITAKACELELGGTKGLQAAGTIHGAHKEEIYRDIVRVPECYRIDGKGPIAEGEVRRIHAGPKSTFVILRGDQQHCTERTVRLDDVTRGKLGVEMGQDVEIEVDSPFLKEWRWAWNGTEIGDRIAARLSVVSLLLGVAGLLLGIISLLR
jgi:hypothetical protein